MNIKTELIALAVRVVADNTSLIRKPDAFEATLNALFGGESYDRQIARNIEEESARLVNGIKRIATDRQFKKITSNI